MEIVAPPSHQPAPPTGSIEVRNPYDGTLVGTVRSCGAKEVDAACAAAARALARRDFPQHRRARVLERAADALGADAEAFAHRIAHEAGKPLRTARGEVERAVGTLRFSAVEARTLAGEMVPVDASPAGEGRVGFALRVPIGVVAAITPFNFPLNLVAHKVAPAIAAGCPVVLKPAPQTPLTALAFVDLLVAAGLPPDWVGVVTDSGREAGQALVAHAVPAQVSFTGSVDVGWAIAAAAPRKRVELELGSNAPVIVDLDADVPAAAAKIAAAAFGYAGQSCIAVQRVLVQEGVRTPFVAALAREADALVVGDPLHEATDVGPLISAREAERVRRWIAAAVAGGGRLAAGGVVEGGLLRPTIVDDSPVDADLWRREVFGPVVAVRGYGAFPEAVDAANDTAYRLQAGLFTNDLSRAMAAVRLLDFGGVVVGDVPTVRLDQQPYGGVGDGGNTREGPAHAVRAMTDLRFVSLPAGV